MKKLFVIMVAAFAFVACQEEKKAEPTTEERVENYLNDLYKAAEDCDAEKFEALFLELEEFISGLSEEEFAKAEEALENWGDKNDDKMDVIDDCMTYGVPEFYDDVDDYYYEAWEDAEEYYDEALEDAEKYYDEALEDAEEYYEAATKAAEKYVDDAMEAADDYVNDALEAAAAYGL